MRDSTEFENWKAINKQKDRMEALELA